MKFTPTSPPPPSFLASVRSQLHKSETVPFQQPGYFITISAFVVVLMEQNRERKPFFETKNKPRFFGGALPVPLLISATRKSLPKKGLNQTFRRRRRDFRARPWGNQATHPFFLQQKKFSIFSSSVLRPQLVLLASFFERGFILRQHRLFLHKNISIRWRRRRPK